MRIQHNIMAMNAYRNYNTNTSALSKNLEKLSSGYKINRAGDDAAGLAISEKMRAQITGLNAAQKNVKDGISLVKTAEGAMQEIQDMLNRMDYLATQSANGTYDNEVDRLNLQKEVNALKSEINRIADSANFNGIKLLDGSLASKDADTSITAGSEVQDKAITLTNATKSVTPAASYAAEMGDLKAEYTAIKVTYTNAEGVDKTLTLVTNAKATADSSTQGEKIAAGLKDGSWTISNSDGNTKDDYTEFLKTFDITGDKKNLTIAAKDPSSGARVTGISQGSASGDQYAAIGALKGVTGTFEKDPVTKITASATGASIKIGGKTYANKNTAATDIAGEVADIARQLREDGYDVSIEKGNVAGDTIRFNNASQLQETQKGSQITNTTADKWDVTADAGTKGEAVFKMDAAADTTTDLTYTLNYVNEQGEKATKELKFKATSADATGAANGLKAAIEGDSDLKALFNVDSATGTITITSKGSGTASGYITGVSSDDNKVANEAVKITKPLDTGKTLKLGANRGFEDGDKITVDGKTYQFMNDVGAAAEDGVIKVAIEDGNDKGTWENLQRALTKNGVESTLLKTNDGLRFVDGTTAQGGKTGGLVLQIGDTSDSWNQLRVNVGDMHTTAMGTGKTTLDGKEINVTKTIADIDISNIGGAQEAIGVIKNAINYVSGIRGDLGAVQNRLEHTANNLSVMAENIQDAESTIRDTDVAEEMMAYTKNNILIQSAQAMLAQANAVPQGVLQLLG